MTTDNGRAFNEWLRAQLKAKKMSQRQLAQQSGVDHSTISRLIRGDRMPSLGTATRLAKGLREIRDDADAGATLGIVSLGPQNPTARVEYALRADEALTEPQVRQIMEYYLAVRVRRFARTYAQVAAGSGTGNGSTGNGSTGNGSTGNGSTGNGSTGNGSTGNGSTVQAGSVYGRPAGMIGGSVGAPTVLRAAPTQRSSAPRPAVRPARPPGRI